MRNWSLDALEAFAAVARNGNMHRAAQELCISQPPLSRKIKRLEKNLGLRLFERYTTGMELTDAGLNLLEATRPLILQAKIFNKKLESIGNECPDELFFGFSTAFEQGIFRSCQKQMEEVWRNKAKFLRKESPRLARDVEKGRLDGAFVALPVELSSCPVMETGYREQLLFALPSLWKQSTQNRAVFTDLADKHMFWYQRARNRAFHDYMGQKFEAASFTPLFIEEPLEHDVLLARIAQGDGWTLMPESFSRITRPGVSFVLPASSCGDLSIGLGLIARNRPILERLQNLQMAPFLK